MLACAGSGKTTTLCLRVLHLIASGVLASRILVLSFSTTAVRELRECLARLAEPGLDIQKITVLTFHAYANRLISKPKKNRNKSESGKLSVLWKPADIKRLMKLAMSAARIAIKASGGKNAIPVAERSAMRRWLAGLNAFERQLVQQLFDHASASRQSLAHIVDRQQHPQFETFRGHVPELVALHSAYARTKREHRMIDYSDMLARGLSALVAGNASISANSGEAHQRKRKTKGKGEAKTKLRAAVDDGTAHLPIQHLLVDEYQDSSLAQVQFIAALAQRNPDLSVMTFGDVNQSLYMFAGATHTPLARLLPDVKLMPLLKSYRLPQALADASTAVLRANGVDARRVEGRGVAGTKPVLVRCSSLTSQLREIANDIKKLIDGGTPAHEIAVLGATRAVLHEAEAALLARSVDTNRRGVGRRLAHVRRVLRLIRLVEVMAADKNCRVISPSDLMAALPDVDAEPERWGLAAKALAKAANSVPSFSGRFIVCARIYLQLCGGIEVDAERQADVNRWESWARGYTDARSMRDALRQLAAPDRVTTSTIHLAKGSQWPHVFVIGVADGQMPSYKAREHQPSLVAELHSMYVAMTRARATLRLYYAPVAHGRSRQRFERLSRFLRRPRVLRYFDVEDRRCRRFAV